MNPIEQTSAAGYLSTRYGFISTKRLIELMAQEGWNVERQVVARSRKVEKIGFEKHLLYFTNPSMPPIPNLAKENESIPAIVLLNSHDGSTAFRFNLGFIRFSCLNGVITSDAVANYRVYHSGKPEERVRNAVSELISSLPNMYNQIFTMVNTQLSQSQIESLAEYASKVRLEGRNGVQQIDFSSVSASVRSEDNENDAFTVMNRIQEKLINGGIRYLHKREDGSMLWKTTRKTRSVTMQIGLNKALYQKIWEVLNA